MAEKDPSVRVTAERESDEDNESHSPVEVRDGQEAEKQSQDSTSPAASSDTDIEIIRSTNVEQDSKELMSDEENEKPVADEDSEKPVRDEDGEKLVSGEDKEKPVRDEDKEKPVRDEDGEKPVRDEDCEKPVRNEDGKKPVRDEDGKKPVRDEDGKKPVRDEDGEKPVRDEDGKKLVSGEDKEKPVRDEDKEKPVRDEEGKKPVRNEDGKKPVRDEDGEKPVRNEDGKKLVSGEDNEKPVTDKDSEKPASNEDCNKQVSSEDDRKPVTPNDCEKSERDEDNGKPVSGKDDEEPVTVMDSRKSASEEDSGPVVTEVVANLEYNDQGQDGRKMENEQTTKKDVETVGDVQVETVAKGALKLHQLHPKMSATPGDGRYSEMSRRHTREDEKSSGEAKVATIESLTASADERNQTERSGTVTEVTPGGDEGDGTDGDSGLRQSLTAEETFGDDTHTKEEEEKKEGSGLGTAAIISVIIVAIGACLVHFHFTSQPPVQENTQQIDLFLTQLEQVKLHFPNQRAELWNRGTIHLQRHLQTVQPTEPVSVILTAGRGAKQTLGCLARDLASAFSFALNASVLHIDGASKASQESDQVKFDIDSQLQKAFEGDKPVAVIHQFEELPPGSTLIFYRYCDHENAAYKKTFLIFTVLLGDEEIPPKIPLSSVEEMVDDHLQKKFLSDDHPVAFDTMDLDKYGGLWSRISHLILPVAAERRIEHEGCKWK